MSQANVERVVGRLATDEGFRQHFAGDPGAALREVAEAGLELTPCEAAVLARIPPAALERFAAALDGRLVKCDWRRVWR